MHSPKDMPTMKGTATSIIRLRKVKHVLSNVTGNTCSYNSEQKQIFSMQHTKSEWTVS